MAWWARQSNLPAFVRIRGFCSGEEAQLVSMAPRGGGGGGALLQPHRSHTAQKSQTQSHGPRYKYFISITIVPHQNYSSTRHKNTKNRFPAPKPMSMYLQRSRPDGSLRSRGGLLPVPPLTAHQEAVSANYVPSPWTPSPRTLASGWEVLTDTLKDCGPRGGRQAGGQGGRGAWQSPLRGKARVAGSWPGSLSGCSPTFL